MVQYKIVSRNNQSEHDIMYVGMYQSDRNVTFQTFSTSASAVWKASENDCCWSKHNGVNALNWNILTDWIFCTGISLLNEFFVLEYFYWMNILYWNIPTDWIICTGISLLIEYFALEYLYNEYFALEYPYWLNIVYCNISTVWKLCTEISLLTEYFVLECLYWLNIVHWNIPTD